MNALRARLYGVRPLARSVFWLVVAIATAFLFWLETSPPRV